MLVNAVNAALEDREIALDGIGVNLFLDEGFVIDHTALAANVFLGGMIDGSVRGEIPAKTSIDVGFVGDEPAIPVGVLGDDRVQHLCGHVRDMEAPHRAAALDQGHDRLLGLGRFESPVLGSGADIGFVGFDGLAFATDRGKEHARLVVHGFADAVTEEPSGFHAATEHALNLVSRNALFAGAHEMDDLQPQLQGQMGRLEDGPHSDGKGLLAGVALVEPRTGGLALQATQALPLPAVMADGAGRPKPSLDIGEGGGFILEVGGGKNGGSHGEISYGHHPTGRGKYVKCNVAQPARAPDLTSSAA